MANESDGKLASVGLLILRVGFGLYLATYGYAKIQMLIGGQAAQFGDPIGIGATASLVLSMLAEFAAALMVALGLFTRIFAAVVAINMAVAGWVAMWSAPLTSVAAFAAFQAGKTKFPASKEPALLYLIAFVALIFLGAGRFSLDALVIPWWKARKAKTTPAES
ncbi:MAG: DoxX family protein [Planctomycetota bacterium]